MESLSGELASVRERLVAGEWPAAVATPVPEAEGEESRAEARTVRLQKPRSARDKESTQPIAVIKRRRNRRHRLPPRRPCLPSRR